MQAEKRLGKEKALMYYAQLLWSDGKILTEYVYDTETDAILSAVRELEKPQCEASYARVITIDGELVWSNKPECGR